MTSSAFLIDRYTGIREAHGEVRAGAHDRIAIVLTRMTTASVRIDTMAVHTPLCARLTYLLKTLVHYFGSSSLASLFRVLIVRFVSIFQIWEDVKHRWVISHALHSLIRI